jgi:hypothetical protein
VICAVLLAVLISSGCAVTEKQPRVYRGNEADGTVVMTYDYGRMERYEVRRDVADDRARDQCQSWDYPGAEFIDEDETCIVEGALGCTHYRVNLRYRYTGSG